MNEPHELWLVWQYRELRHEVQGIFSTREKAIAACRNENYCTFPLELDQLLPDSTLVIDAFYPIG